MDVAGQPHRPQQASTSQSATACANGIAVPEPQANQGLVHDCAILLAVRDALAGDAALKLERLDRDIHDWRGVWVSPVGWDTRVVALELPLSGLTGTLPPALGELAELGELNLRGNKLSGTIPAELGALEVLGTLES